MGIGVILNFVFTVASTIYAQKEQKKLQAQAQDAAATRDVRITGSNDAIRFIYGTSFVEPQPVFVDVSSSVTFLTESSTTTTIGNLGNVSGAKNEILLIQRVLGFGEISEVNFVDVDGANYNDPEYNVWFKTFAEKQGGITNKTAVATSTDRDANSTFNDLSYATEFFRMNRGDPQYSGRPGTGYYITGRLVSDITRTGTSPDFTYAISATKTYSANSTRVLLDYMMDDNGANIPVSSIDLESFYNAIQVCEKVVQADAQVQGKIFGNGIFTRDIKKHEFNGLIFSSDDHITNIEDIIDSIPGGVLLRSATGLLKMSIPDEDLTNAEISVSDITQDDILDFVTISSPSTNNKLNKVTLSYPNISKDFSSDLYVLDNSTFFALDNDVTLEATVSPSGCNNIYHAEHYSDTSIVRSRRNSYEFTMRTWGVILEPGDVVKIDGKALYPTALPANQVDQYVRIQILTPQRDLTIKVVAQEFDILDYTWGDKTDEIIAAGPVFDFTVEPPTDIDADEVTGSNTNPITGINITWVDPDDFRVTDVLLEVQYGSGPFMQIGTIPVGVEQFDYQPVLVQALTFRVRSLTLYNQKSAYETLNNAITPSFTGVQAINPNFSKTAIVFSEGDFTNANVKFYVLDGGAKLNFVDVSDDADLEDDQWRVTSVTSDSTITFTSVNDFDEDEINITVTGFTGQGAINVNFNLKDTNGDVSSLTASIDVAQAEKGDDGQDGSFTQLRYSDDTTQPLPATYPTNDDGTNATWTISSSNAIWVISREITFSSDNVRTNGAWTISKFSGADGTNSVTINATTDDYSVIYDEDGLNPSPASVTLTGSAQGVSNGFFKFTGGGADFPDETTFTDGDTALTATRTFTLPTSITSGTVRNFEIAVADGDQTELSFDTLTIALIRTPADGTDGEDAITIILQNEATVLPSSNSGVVSSYVGSNNVIEAYRGSTALTYSSSSGNPSTSEFKLSTTDTNITIGAITLSGNNAVVADASAFTDSTDTAEIAYTITVRNEADDANFTFTKTHNFSKSKTGADGSGTDGIRGSGDWHYRFGVTLDNSYTDSELNSFLAMTIPGTDFDDPTPGDRLWVFASPSTIDLTVTDQKVYIYLNDTDLWEPQAQAIDGNLLVSGTVTADNVVADISISAPVITGGTITAGTLSAPVINGGLLTGSIIDTGILRAGIIAFLVNQNTDTSIFSNLSEKQRAFTRGNVADPVRFSTTFNGQTLQYNEYVFSIATDDRHFNVNEDVPSSLLGYGGNPQLLSRNWYTSVPYELSVTYPLENLGSNDGEATYGMLFPACTVRIMSGDTVIDTMTLPSKAGLSSGDFYFNPNAGVTGTGRFADFELRHEGQYFINKYTVKYFNKDSAGARNGMAIYGRGFIHLQDDEYVEVTLGSASASGGARTFGLTNIDVDVELKAYSVGLETDFNAKTQYYFDIDDETQVDGGDVAPSDLSIDIGSELQPINLSIPQDALVFSSLSYNPLSNRVSVDAVPVSVLEGPIDATEIEVTNVKPENIVAGNVNAVNLYSGDLNIDPSLTYGQSHTLNEIIDLYLESASGKGYNLTNEEGTQPYLAVGDFDDTDPDAWVATNDYTIGDLVTSVSLFYVASADITGSASNTAPASDTDNWDLIELPRNSYLFYSQDTGLIVGGTITAGSIRGGDLTSSVVPTGTESGTYIDLDGGTFVFGNATENLQYDGTNITLSGIPIDGELIVNNSIDGNKLDINTVIARTIRSDNYIPPSLTDNPPIQGYSLEHVEGIGFFEELRADLTGTVTAPSQTPSQGTYTYNTSAATVEYLNISVGDTFTDFPVVYEGVTHTFKGVLSTPIYELTLPDSLRFFNNPAFNDNWAGAALLTNGAAYEWYSNLSSNSQSYGANYRVGMVWVGYDDNDNIVTTVPIRDGINVETTVSWYTGITRIISAPTAEDTADEIDDFSTLNNFELSTPLPTVLKLQMILISLQSDMNSTVNDRPGDTSPLAITGGIRANSSISFEVRSNDGTTSTETITQITS